MKEYSELLVKTVQNNTNVISSCGKHEKRSHMERKLSHFNPKNFLFWSNNAQKPF